MSRYVMKQNWMCWGDDYTVRDESGREVLYIDGKVFSLRTTLVVKDMSGNELATIQKKILALGPTYEIYRDGRLSAVVKKSLFTLFRCHFTLDVPGPNDPIAEGSFWEYEYAFSRSGRAIAHVSKKFFSWNDTYGIDIAKGEDEVLLISAAVVIDQCCHEDKR